jgi:hypothetical protein
MLAARASWCPSWVQMLIPQAMTSRRRNIQRVQFGGVAVAELGRNGITKPDLEEGTEDCLALDSGRILRTHWQKLKTHIGR